jgi:hypothetical protein
MLKNTFESIVAERGAGGVHGNSQVVLDVVNGLIDSCLFILSQFFTHYPAQQFLQRRLMPQDIFV